jgi:type VII secretion ATPase EccA
MSLTPDLIRYYNQGLTAWSQNNVPAALENFVWCRDHVDGGAGQCDLQRALAGLVSTAELATEHLKQIWDTQRTWGELIVAAGRARGEALTANTTFLGLTVPVVPAHSLTMTLNTPTAINIGYATLLASEQRFDEAWEVIDAATSTIPQVDLVKVVIYAAAERWQDVIDAAEPILSPREVDADEKTISQTSQLVQALAYLYSGMGYAHLGRFPAAESALRTAERSTYRTVGAEACYYLGLIARAGDDETKAIECFNGGLLYQRTDKLLAALDDHTVKLRQTTAQLIADRGSYWDVSSEADLREVREAERVETQNTMLLEATAKLDENIGMSEVKDQIIKMRADVAWAAEAARRGVVLPGKSNHLVFAGPPGTGKTTIARVVAMIYCGLGILRGSHVVEVSRRDLVGEHIGETEAKTDKKIDEALDGVLFLDEAYSLVTSSGKNDFGPKALEVLLARMENDRDRLVVIIAGYEKEINQLLAYNEGFESRFSRRIRFASYTPDELGEIAEVIAKKRSSRLSVAARDLIVAEARAMTIAAPSGKKVLDTAGNARFVRNVLEASETNRSARLAGANLQALSDEEMFCLLPEDVEPAMRNIVDPLIGRHNSADAPVAMTES